VLLPADIQRGMGVVSMRDMETGTTYFKAVVCPADSYGITGSNTTSGVFKKYGRTVTPCTACPTNMLTGQYDSPEKNAENKITGYLTKTGAGNLDTQTTAYSADGGYVSVDACATQVGAQAAQAVPNRRNSMTQPAWRRPGQCVARR
jgi:hypothetical protein